MLLSIGESVLIPDKNLLGVLLPNAVAPFHDTNQELTKATDAVRQFIGKSRRILVLVNDYTRPTPNTVILEQLEPALTDTDVRYLVGTGTHRAPTDQELEAIFGSELLKRIRSRITIHDCQDQSRLFFVGKTSFGTAVWLNRDVLWAERIITINSIEPHYFAGYTGGRKAFLPGIAGLTTITQNHNMVTRPGSATFVLKGNPVSEDMTECAQMVPRPVFSIQVVQDQHYHLLSVRYGDLFRSFEQAAADAYQVFAVPINQKADIVLSVLGKPYDINFYQAQRAVEFARPVLNSPGIQITVSACHDGIGNDGFIRAFQHCARPQDILANPGSDPRLGWHKSARLAQIMETIELYTVMGIDDNVVRSVFMTPFHSAQEALAAAFARLGKDATVYVIPDAGAVVPVLVS